MTKLMITALLFCSSLSFAGEAPSTAAPKKKMSKLIAPAPTDSSAQKVDETVFGGLGTGGLSTAAPKKKAVPIRGTAPEARK